jgi:hypothetical protein
LACLVPAKTDFGAARQVALARCYSKKSHARAVVPFDDVARLVASFQFQIQTPMDDLFI